MSATTCGADGSVTMTLTEGEAMSLKMYLLISTSWRQREAAACRRLGEERKEDGYPVYQNMIDNADWWDKTNDTIETIQGKLEPWRDRRAAK